MIDAMPDDEPVFVEDLVHDSVRTATSAMEAGEFTLQRAADATGVLRRPDIRPAGPAGPQLSPQLEDLFALPVVFTPESHRR